MIESRELRIGNYVKYGTDDMPVILPIYTGRVAAIGLLGIITFGNEPYNHIHMPKARIVHCEGIPLTGEVLSEWCGFEKDIHFYTKRITTELQVTVGVKSGDLSLMTPYFGTDFPMPHIKYLHQLQNMIYAVSGRELEVKTP